MILAFFKEKSIFNQKDKILAFFGNSIKEEKKKSNSGYEIILLKKNPSDYQLSFIDRREHWRLFYINV